MGQKTAFYVVTLIKNTIGWLGLVTETGDFGDFEPVGRTMQKEKRFFKFVSISVTADEERIGNLANLPTPEILSTMFHPK